MKFNVIARSAKRDEAIFGKSVILRREAPKDLRGSEILRELALAQNDVIRRLLRFARNDMFLLLFFLVHVSPVYAFNLFSAAQNERGNRQYEKGQVSKARKTYESALRSDSKSPEIAFNLGNAYYKERSFAESLKRYADAALAEKDPLFRSRAFYNLGNALYRAGQTDKAIEAYKQALRLHPKDQDAKYNLEFLNKKKEDEKKKPDEKKDPQKDQQKDQQKDRQKNQDPEKNQQGGGAGQQGDDPQQGSAGGGEGQGSEDKKDQDRQQEQEQNQGQDEQQPAGSSQQGQQERPAGRQAGEENQEDSRPQAGEGRGEAQGEEEQPVTAGAETPKTDAQRRAEQILAALQGQEQQVFRMQNDGERRRTRAQRVMEKDW